MQPNLSNNQNQSPENDMTRRPFYLRKRTIAVVSVIVFIFVAVGSYLLLMPRNTPSSERELAMNQNTADKLMLTPFMSKEAAFRMEAPKDASVDGYADDEFEGGYTVTFDQRNDQYGNRTISVQRDVFTDEYLQLPYEKYKQAMTDSVQSEIDAGGDSEVFESDASVVSEKEQVIAGHKSIVIKWNETVRNTKSSDSESNSYEMTEVFIYVDETTSYSLRFKSRADDKAFQTAIDDMISSFKTL